jgi:uncharacterized membrane protein YeaQ/YmgE (transglycosylase-associated protein family)
MAVHELLASVFAVLADHWLGYLDQGLVTVLGVPAGISVLYFLLGNGARTSVRLLKSCHGVLLVVAWFYALAVDTYDAAAADWLVYPFLVIIGAACASMIYSLWGMSTHRYVHIVHILTASYGLIILYRGLFVFDSV